MVSKWNKTNYPGVRYRQHPFRKHGVQSDKYFSIYYKISGKRHEEGLGWASQGWSASKASEYLAELKRAHRTGEGAQTLAEKRAIAEAKREEEAAAKAEQERLGITFSDFFTDTYFPQAKADKSEASWKKEDQCFRLWISPVIGDKPLTKVSPLDLERIKKNMFDAKRAPRSVHYCLAVVRQVFNHARRLDIFTGDNPVSKVKKPTVDNRRLRFLSHEEADLLLEALKKKSRDVHDMALTSLHCGLRAGEIYSLKWSDVDPSCSMLTLRDTKSGKSRITYTTQAVKAMLNGRTRLSPGDLVFPARGGGPVKQISSTFDRVVDNLGLNDGIGDPRHKVVFHTLRHTYASWLVAMGTDLYTVKELMGHSSLTMTERYAHLAPDKLKRAVQQLDDSLQQESEDGKLLHLRQLLHLRPESE